MNNKPLIAFLTVFAALVLLQLYSAAAHAFGPYDAQLVRVIDGDTYVMDVAVWPGPLTQTAAIRLRGANTPESRTTLACEKQAGLAATAYAKSVLSGAVSIVIEEVDFDKFGGRYDARVIVDGRDLAQLLIAQGLAVPYAGGVRKPWCE